MKKINSIIEEIFDKEKQYGLEGLLKKYSKDCFKEGLDYIKKLNDKTKVFKISKDHISGKQR